MKKNLLFLLAFLTFSLLLVSCNKEDDLNDVLSTEDMTLAEDLLNSIDESADEISFSFAGESELETRSLECVEITSTAPLGQYPNTITLDYGDGCEGPYGRVRTGKIIIHISDKMTNEGAVRTVGFEDFFVDEVQITGTKSMTNEGLNGDGQVVFTHEVNGITLIFPNGETATRHALRTVTWLEGYETGNRFDNVVAITGTANGETRTGVSYSSVIIEPLIKRGNCRWISEGVMEITRDDQTVSLDYGDGACNGVATVTFADGSTREINLYRKWWK